MSDIKLNFINMSNDVNNSEVVIFQKNVATNFDELSVAWKVIQNCGRGDHHPFVFPMDDMTVNAGDSWGNYTAQQEAENGQLYAMKLLPSGDQLVNVGAGTSASEVQLRNDLTQGAISANIYKGGQLLATKTNVAPGQKAVFQFMPTIWIGLASQVVEGLVMNSAVISSINTQISLLGIASADIVMRGGGYGPSAAPYTFTLANVVMA